MEKKYEMVFDILSSVDKLGMEDYLGLISEYGEETVGSAIDDLVEKDAANIYRFEVYYSIEADSLESTVDMSCYSIYSSDVGMIPVLDKDKNLILLKKIFPIINELNALFLSLNCVDSLWKNVVPWIDDKVTYCLENCNNSSMLKRLNDLYGRYLSIRKTIIEGNLRLVVLIAGDYETKGITSFEDIIQYGNIGLMRAVEKYDITRETPFSNYAISWIKQSIRRNIRNIMYPTHIPEHKISEKRMISNAINDLAVQMGRDATNRELSEYLNVSVDDIKKTMMLFLQNVSLNDSYVFHDDDEFILEDLVVDDSPNVDEIVYGKDMTDKFEKILKDNLTEKQLFVIRYYFGFVGSEYSLPEIALMLGVSRQRVSELKNLAVRKLKKVSTILSNDG